MTLKIILLSIGILALIESSITILFPKWIRKISRVWLKNTKTLRKIGLIEFIFAVILILIGMIL